MMTTKKILHRLLARAMLVVTPVAMSMVFSASAVAAPAAEPQRIEIWPEGVPGLHADAAPDKEENSRVSAVHTPTITVYPAPADKANGTAIIICPGGGYVRLSIVNEGSSIAAWMNSLGVTAFVLRYRMVEYGHPAPLRDVLRAIRTVRSRADEFHVRADRIGVIGASAGGHLASCAATLYDLPEGKTGAAIDAVSARPDFAVLMYPVITMKDPFVHAGSRRALLGEHPTPELIEQMSTELHVTKATPPTFLVHTTEDKTVPVENSLMFYQALRNAGVPAELHVYERGPHGIGLRPQFLAAVEWPKACEAWLRQRGLLTAPAP